MATQKATSVLKSLKDDVQLDPELQKSMETMEQNAQDIKQLEAIRTEVNSEYIIKNISADNSSETFLLSEQEKNTVSQEGQEVAQSLLEYATVSSNKLDIQAAVEDLVNLGTSEMQESSKEMDSLLGKRLSSFTGTASEKVSKQLGDLNSTIMDIAPQNRSRFMRFARKIPFIGKNVQNYFVGLDTAKETIENIQKGLLTTKAELTEEFHTISLVRANLVEKMKVIEGHIIMLKVIDAKLIAGNEVIANENPQLAKDITEEMIKPIRTRLLDLSTHYATLAQATQSFKLIQAGSRELINNIERARLTTTTSLKTAMTVAAAIDTQKKGLAITKTVKETNDQLMRHNAEQLETHTIEIHKQSQEMAVDINSFVFAINKIKSTSEAVQKLNDSFLEQTGKALSNLEAVIEDAAKVSVVGAEDRLKGLKKEDVMSRGDTTFDSKQFREKLKGKSK